MEMTLPARYTLRPATAGDVDTIALHRYPDASDALHRPAYAEWVGGMLAQRRYTGLLVTRESVIVAGAGLALLDWWPTRADPNPVRARLVNVWTHPEHRRQGLARRLAQTLLNEAQARGIRTVSLSTTQAGRTLYEGLGFQAYPHEMLLTLDGAP